MMARWPVCALVLLQALLLVMAEEAATETSSSAATSEAASKSSESATRMSSPGPNASEVPPLVHGEPNTTAVPNVTETTTPKSEAGRLTHQLGLFVVGVLLSVSAI